MANPGSGTQRRDAKIRLLIREVGWMKITIELDGVELKALLALSLAAWCALEGQPMMAGAVMALAAVWKV